MTDHDLIALFEPLIRGLKVYHRYSVAGLENIPLRSRGIIVVNHSFATYDICMLIHSIQRYTGRFPRPLVDRLFAKIPPLRILSQRLGCVPGDPERAQELLAENQLIMVAPGGMGEAIRPYTEKYQLKWSDKRGFVRLAIDSNTPILLAFCPQSDDLYKVYDTKVTQFFYRNFRFPMMVMRGLGPTLLPRPVKLKHFISAPIYPPAKPQHPDEYEAVVDEFHQQMIEQAQAMISQSRQRAAEIAL